MTAEERITRLEAAMYKLIQAVLANSGDFTKEVLDQVTFAEMELIYQPEEM